MPSSGNCCESVIDTVAKLLCIGVLVAQLAVLDSFFFVLDYDGSISAAVWIILDVLVFVWWVFALLMPKCMGPCLRRLPPKLSSVLGELKYAYISWVLYSTILCLKIIHMFSYFADYLKQKPELYSSTGLKLTFSVAAVVFLLLSYCRRKELKGVYYKLTMEKVAFSACLDILDALMLLDILFIRDSNADITVMLDRVVKAFSCICIILPTFPLLVLRCVQTPAPKHKMYRFTLILQSALYLLLVNFPLFSIRLHFWFTYNVNLSTFFTKNLIMMFKGLLEILKESVKWYKDEASTSGYVSGDPQAATKLNNVQTKLDVEDV